MCSGEMHGEGSILSEFLPNVHPVMIWGVDPVLFANDNSAGITGLQLIDFLTSIDLWALLVPGVVLIPSLLPCLPPTGSVLNLEDLVPKRVYILGYLPSFFWCHLMSKILRSLAHHCFLQGDSLPPLPRLSLVSPSAASESSCDTHWSLPLLVLFSRTLMGLSCGWWCTRGDNWDPSLLSTVVGWMYW